MVFIYTAKDSNDILPIIKVPGVKADTKILC